MLAQPAAPPGSQISAGDGLTTELYSVFASEIVRWDRLADRGDAQRKDARASRHHFKEELTLTDKEEAILKRTMHSCADSTAAWQAAQKALLDGFKAQNPKGAKLSPELSQQLQQNLVARVQLILSCVDSLRSALGAATFQKVDHYVRTAVRSRTAVVSVPTGGSAK